MTTTPTEGVSTKGDFDPFANPAGMLAILPMNVFECPVLDCGYTYTPDAKLIPDMGPLDGVLGLAPGTMARQAVHQNNEEIERTLRAHLDGHTSVEWLRTTMQLQRALDERRAADGDPRVAQVCSTTTKHDAHAWTTNAGTRWCPGRYV